MKKAILSIIILSFLVGTVGFAQEAELPSPGITPNSPFYFLDTLGEKIGMLFAFGAEKKAEKALKYAEEKLAEVKVMAEKNKTKALKKANQRYQIFLGFVNVKTKEAKEKGNDVEELAVFIAEKLLKHQEVLVGVFEKIPVSAKTAVQKAIEVSRKGSEEAVKAVSKAETEGLQQKIEEVKAGVEKRIEFRQMLDEIIDWKVYRSEKYGYEVKYPQDWELAEHGGVPLNFGQLSSFWVQSDEYSIGPYTRRDSVIVNVWNPSFYSYERFLEELPPGGIDPDTIKKKEIIIDQESATEISYTIIGDVGSGAREGKRVFVQKDQLMVTISCDSEKCDQVLSAFRFVELEEVEEKIPEVKETEKRPISCQSSLDCPSQMKCENSGCVDVGCTKEGEDGPSAGINPEWLEHLPSECCGGLKSITHSGYYDKNCNFEPLVGGPSGTCSKCGNKICEAWETKCNCPEDCGVQCLTEGETYMPGSDKQCCVGLKGISLSVGDGRMCSLTAGYVCTAFCGDGKCAGEHENPCNCSEDCPPAPPPEEEKIILNSPNGGEVWTVGNTHTIFWESTTLTDGLTNVNIKLLSQQMGAPSSTYHVRSIASGVDVTEGFYRWYIPAEIPRGSLPEIPLADYTCHKIEVVDSRYGRNSQVTRVISDESDACFRIIGEACPLPEAPVLTDPGISVNKHQPFALNWTSISGAKWYALQYNTSTDFSIAPPPWISESNSDTDNPGVGTSSPEVTTTYYYRVRACNDCGCGSYGNVVDMQVIVPSSITVTSPNGGEEWVIGESYNITWVSTGVDKIDLSVNYGTGYLGLGGEVPSVGIDAALRKFTWQIDANAPYVPGDGLKIKIIDASDSTIYDESDNYFSIVESVTCIHEEEKNGVTCGGYFYEDYCSWTSDGTYYTTIRKCNASEGSSCGSLVGGDRILCPFGCQSGACLPGITVTSPNGGEVWRRDSTYDITWISSGVEKITINYVDYSDRPLPKTIAVCIPASSGKYSWKTPLDFPLGTEYKIKISECYGPDGRMLDDLSDNYFSIGPSPGLLLKSASQLFLSFLGTRVWAQEVEPPTACGKFECAEKSTHFEDTYGPGNWTDAGAECICQHYTSEEWELTYCALRPPTEEELQIWRDCGVPVIGGPMSDSWGWAGKEEGPETIEPANLTQLTFVEHAADPDWSFDGSQLAFHNFITNRIGIINADGTGLRYLGIGGDPNWSPVENKLAVMAWKKEQNLPALGIYFVDPETEDTTFLVMGHQACWSPDGTKIAYTLDERGLSSIWVINSDGSGKTRLTFRGDGYSTGLSFSYDGSKIVYLKGFTSYAVGGEDVEANEIWVMDADGSNKHMIYAPGDSSQLLFQRAWNKDNKILFMRTWYRRYPPQVWMINSDGSDPEPFVSGSDVFGDPVWDNTGTKVAIHRITPPALLSGGNIWTFSHGEPAEDTTPEAEEEITEKPAEEAEEVQKNIFQKIWHKILSFFKWILRL